MHVKTLILGGGITGLSTAYHLNKLGQTDYLIIEKEQKPGGLCRSIYQDGFTFDYGGHLLHLHTSYGKKLLFNLLPDNLHCITRNAWIYTSDYKVPFPFQANLYALPPHVRNKCIAELIKVSTINNRNPPKNFEEWCIRSFGDGIYKAFMYPYNKKMWGCEPSDLTCEWCGNFVPAPSKSDIKRSAILKPSKEYGYNPSFYYPKRGGCGAVIDALTENISQLLVNTEISQIDLRNKKVFANGIIISYEYLVNTLPLSCFLEMLQSSPLKMLADDLRCQQVTVLLIAIKGYHHSFSWIYFPDKEDPFFRIGMQSSFSSNNAPADSYSYYVEFPGLINPSRSMEKKTIQILLKKGLINESDEILFSIWKHIPYGYVIYDNQRTSIVNMVLNDLENFQCLCAGRFALWEYSFIEKALIQGKDVALKIHTYSKSV